MQDTPPPSPKNAVGDPGRVTAHSGASEGGLMPPNNLPLQLSSFVGRGREITEVEGLLAGHRLLTLTGPGGSGKTRLALAEASDLASAVTEDLEDGVWLVELAPLTEPDLVPGAVASVLGVRETPAIPLAEALRAHLQTRRVLLVLDNCEHLVEACARLVGALLGSCPNLRVLATSREALGVPGETLYPVPPLSLPDPRLPAAEDLVRYEAARLFVDRATAVKHDFTLDEDNAPAVAQICYRLDGMPLAIELAAARVRVLSVEQISSRLEDSFALLSAGGRAALPRHKTLRATMDWSHDLLSEEERALLRRLSVFAGGFTLAAAEAVCAGGGLEGSEMLDLLASLVDKSLVLVSERDGEVRYWLLETVRQYAAEKLEEAGEEAEVGERHTGFFVGLAEEAEPGLKGHGQVEWLGRLENENDNLRAAMRWSLDHRETGGALRLALALWLFWYLHGHQAEGYRYAGELLDKADLFPAATRAEALLVRGNMSYGRESPEGTERLFEEAVVLSRQTGNKIDLAIALAGMGVTAMQRGDMRRATDLFEEVLKLYREEANDWGISYALVHLGMAPLSRGDYEGARRYFEEALALSRKIGYRLSGYISLYGLALAAHARGDRERAAELYAEGLELAVEVGDKANAAYCLEGLAGLTAAGDEPERAAWLFGAAEAMLEEVGAPRYAHAQDRTLHEGAVGALRSRLGEEAFETAWADGRAMPSERAIEYALATPVTPDETEAPHPAGLSAREVEVLKLVAGGMTNAEIAKELYISRRTVNRHVGSVYRKIGTSTRAEAARFASEHGLL